MEVVTGFSTSMGEDEELSYSPIFKALYHSQEVAENAFARVAKTHFRRLVGPSSMKASFGAMADAAVKGRGPIWFIESNVVLHVLSTVEEQELRLSEMVTQLATVVIAVIDGKKLVSIDPLKTSISEVGVELYRFTIKQMWSIKDE